MSGIAYDLATMDGFIRHARGLAFRNSTRLDSMRLLRMFAEGMAGWPLDGLSAWVRYTRGADYSGTCFTNEGRIYINIGRRLAYPYRIGTHIAPAVSHARSWSKPIFTVECADAYELALFIFLHECYHWLVGRAKRNGRQKESMCDRFATRFLVQRWGCQVRCEKGYPAQRATWDFQDVERFVAAARCAKPRTTALASPQALGIVPGIASGTGQQLLLFQD